VRDRGPVQMKENLLNHTAYRVMEREGETILINY